MKKLLSIFVALLALGLFALPAMAVSDNVTVSVTIDTVQTIDYTGTPNSFTFDGSDTNSWQYFTDDAVDDLSGSNNVSGDVIYVKYLDTGSDTWDTDMVLYVEKTHDWNTYQQINTTNASLFTPGTGTFDYDADLAVYCADWWGIAPGNYAAKITFTLTT
jgi:hypothetical protein